MAREYDVETLVTGKVAADGGLERAVAFRRFAVVARGFLLFLALRECGFIGVRFELVLQGISRLFGRATKDVTVGGQLRRLRDERRNRFCCC